MEIILKKIFKELNYKFFVEEKILIKFTLLIFILAFSFLIYYDIHFKPRNCQINKLSLKDLNKYVDLEGVLISQKIYKNNSFFIVQSLNSSVNKSIKMVFFNFHQRIRDGLKYHFIGKVSLNQRDNLLIILNEVY